jgi:death on curing protein
VVWIEAIQAVAMHDLALALDGGLEGVTQMALLESALSRPLTRWQYQRETTLPELAAAYAFGIARNHPFVDGNKRTAFLVAVAFTELNGYRFEAPEAEAAVIFEALAAGEIEEAGLAKWFERHLRKTG